jgi:hypothetical protein
MFFKKPQILKNLEFCCPNRVRRKEKHSRNQENSQIVAQTGIKER